MRVIEHAPSLPKLTRMTHNGGRMKMNILNNLRVLHFFTTLARRRLRDSRKKI